MSYLSLYLDTPLFCISLDYTCLVEDGESIYIAGSEPQLRRHCRIIDQSESNEKELSSQLYSLYQITTAAVRCKINHARCSRVDIII